MKLATLSLLVCLTTCVSAQVPTRALKIADGFADYETNRLEEITNIYFSGDWNRLQEETIRLLERIQFRSLESTSPVTLDFRKHYYSVVFVYTAPDREQELLRYLVHIPDPPAYISRIPGIKAGDETKFYEIFLTLDLQDVLISTYISTKEKSNLESQLPRFFKQFDPKVFAGLLAVQAPNRMYAVLSRVDLPFSRATIQVKDVVQKTKGKVDQDSKLFNRPLTRFSFGVVSSLVVSSHESSPRGVIQSGDLTKDPLRGHMPMGVLNVHPVPYDAETNDPEWSERFRLFIGGILAPDFGISVGAGIQLVRGFSLNAGIGILLIDTLKEGEQFGNEPLDSQDPFEYGTAAVLFVGFGYNF